MTYYVIICETGFMGCANYNRYDEAKAAAEWRTYCTGLNWYVKEMITRHNKRE